MGKRDKGWSVFQRGAGPWVVAYRREDGTWGQHRVPEALTGRREAERYADRWLAEQRASGRLAAPLRRGQEHTVEGLHARWLTLREANPRVKASTVADNRSHMRAHIIPTLGPVLVDTLSVPRLREWVRELRGRVASASACRNVLVTLSSFLADAIAEGWTVLRDNPAASDAVRSELPEVEHGEVVYLVLSDAEQLLACAAVPADRRVRYVLGLLTGMRDGEVAGGSWEDVDLDGTYPTWKVHRACAVKGEDGYATMASPKTRKSRRVIPLHTLAVDALRWWHDDGWPLLMGRTPEPADAVFPSPVSGHHYRPRSADFIREDLAAAGVAHPERYDFRALRRSFATWLYESGVDEETRGRLMGHASGSVTSEHYTAAVLARLSEAVGRLSLRCARFCARRTTDGAGEGACAHHGPRSADDVSDAGQPRKQAVSGALDPICARGSMRRLPDPDAPVAQGIEQRFPNTIGALTGVEGSDDAAVFSAAYAALVNGVPASEVRKTLCAQSPHNGRRRVRERAAEGRRRETRAAELLDEAVSIACTSGDDEGRREAVQVRIAEVADLLLGR